MSKNCRCQLGSGFSGDQKSFADPAKTVLLREKEPRLPRWPYFLKAYAFADGPRGARKVIG